jgi:hypothetical protein
MDNPGIGWKSAWSDLSPDNDVFVHEMDALAAINLESKCSNHGPKFFCLSCLPRIEKALRAARVCLDPEASPIIEKSSSSIPYPEPIALVNDALPLVQRKGFKIGSPVARNLLVTKQILTSMDPDRNLKRVLLARHVTQSQVCDAVFMSAFSVRLDDQTPAEFAKRLWNCPFTFQIDGGKLVELPFREVLQQQKVILKRLDARKTFLFSACGLMESGDVDGSDWLGYFLPNGAVIEAWLENIPGGGGLIKVHTQWDYADYSTRGTKQEQA